jgi:hypothetical protein
MKLFVTALAVIAIFSFASWSTPAWAQTPFAQADFESTFPSFGYSYTFSGYGGFTPENEPVNVDSSSQNTASFDVATGPAATGTLDTSAWVIPPGAPYNYVGWGLGIGFVFNNVTLSSGDLSDYSVTFDASASGYTTGDDGVNTELKVIFQAVDDEDEDTDAEGYVLGASINNPGGLPAVPLLTTTPQTLTINLGDLVPPTEFDYDFTTDFADTFIVMLELAPNSNAGEIGVDADNIVHVDNIRFDGPFVAPPAGGDFDLDGDVDGNDFLVWQRGESPGGVIPEDLAEWIANFPQAGAAAVPEPASAALLGSFALVWAAGRRGARRERRG